MVLAENKAKCLLSVNHTTKTIYHYYRHQISLNDQPEIPEDLRLRRRSAYQTLSKVFLYQFLTDTKSAVGRVDLKPFWESEKMSHLLR